MSRVTKSQMIHGSGQQGSRRCGDETVLMTGFDLSFAPALPSSVSSQVTWGRELTSFPTLVKGP